MDFQREGCQKVWFLKVFKRDVKGLKRGFTQDVYMGFPKEERNKGIRNKFQRVFKQ